MLRTCVYSHVGSKSVATLVPGIDHDRALLVDKYRQGANWHDNYLQRVLV